MKIYSIDGYYEEVQRRSEMYDLRDRLEEKGFSTSNIEDQIEEISEAISEYKKNHNEEFDKEF